MISSFFDLDRLEQKKFDRFLKSPYHNSNKTLIKLPGVLKRFNSENFLFPANKKIIWNEVMGDEKYDDVRFRKLLSDFYKMYEKFLAQEEFEKDTQVSKIYLNLNLMNKSDFETIKKTSIGEIKKNENQFLKDDKEYLYTSWFYDDLYYCEYSMNPLKYPTELVKKGENLDMFYFFSKLHNYFSACIHRYNFKFGDPDKEKFIPEILSYIENNKKDFSKNHPNVYIPFLGVKFFIGNYDLKILKEYESYLEKIDSKLDKERKYYFRSYLMTLYRILAEQGDENAWGNIFLINKYLADTDNLTPENHITVSLFYSMVFEALHMKEIEWAEKFINKYSSKLPKEDKTSCINLALARLNLYKGEYEMVIDNLKKIDLNTPIFYTNSKTITCFLYYDIGEFELIIPVLDSLRKYLNRNKSITTVQININESFIEYFKLLLKSKNDKFELKKLHEKLITTKERISSKNLLIERVTRALENKR